NVRKARKKDCSKLRCFNCQGFGHFAAACQKPKKKISGDGPPDKQNNLEVEEAPSDKDVEYITFGAMEENGAEGVAVSKAQVGRSPESGRAPLMIKSGVMNGKVVKILIDSGASNSLCRVGLGKHVIRSKAICISGYDGLMSLLTETREMKETVQIGTFTFHDTQLTDHPGGSAADALTSTTSSTDKMSCLRQSMTGLCFLNHGWPRMTSNALSFKSHSRWILKHCHVQAQPQEYPAEIKAVLDEFKDVFLKELPDGLPPERGVQFDFKLKPDAKPQNRPPFRLAKVEQESLDKFVDKLKAKGWVELSTSDWVSNIFGVRKKDENGKMPSRQVWSEDGNGKHANPLGS
ncbi:hypothetical protein AaE_004326, partial [Aphanomyces astaci]